MDLSKSITVSLGVCLLIGACAPFPGYYRGNRPPSTPTQPPGEQTITSEEQRQIEESRKRLEREEELRRMSESGQWGQAGVNDGLAPKPKYPTASPVPGKPGFVFNPYTHNIVDVKGIASGRLCRDPEDPDPSHKFRVP